MPIKYKKLVAAFEEQVGVAEAEELLAWLQEDPNRKINLKKCEHIHAAVLQTLMYQKPLISVEPEDSQLSEWLSASNII